MYGSTHAQINTASASAGAHSLKRYGALEICASTLKVTAASVQAHVAALQKALEESQKKLEDMAREVDELKWVLVTIRPPATLRP